MNAYKKQSADASDLRKNGYKKEATAVQKVANRSKSKAEASQAKYDRKVAIRKARKYDIQRSKIHGKITTDAIRYNNNVKKAIRKAKIKNTLKTGATLGALATIGASKVTVTNGAKRLPNVEKKVKALLVGGSIAGGALAINKARKKNKMINEYKKK